MPNHNWTFITHTVSPFYNQVTADIWSTGAGIEICTVLRANMIPSSTEIKGYMCLFEHNRVLLHFMNPWHHIEQRGSLFANIKIIVTRFVYLIIIQKNSEKTVNDFCVYFSEILLGLCIEFSIR